MPGRDVVDELARLRAEADQWMDWNHALWTALRPAFLGLIRTPPESRNEAAIAESLGKTSELLRLADLHLAARSYLAGDDFTIGDIPAGCAIWRWLAMPIDRPALPHLVRWFERLRQRPAYLKIVVSPLT